MSDAKKHHIVPVCLLKKFADHAGQLARLKFRESWAHARNRFYPNQLGYEEDFFRIKDNELNIDSVFVEAKINTSYENDFNRCWINLENNTSRVSITSKRRICEIMIHLKMRNRYMRNGVFKGEGLQDLVKKFQENYLEDLKNGAIDTKSHELYKFFLENPGDLENIAQCFFPEGREQFLHNIFLLNQEKGAETNSREILIDKYLNSTWTIHVAEPGLEFILGDNVGMTFESSKKKLPMTGAFDFLFPISSSRYLQICYTCENLPRKIQELVYYADASDENVISLNTTVLGSSVSEIYGSNGQLLENTKTEYLKEKPI